MCAITPEGVFVIVRDVGFIQRNIEKLLNKIKKLEFLISLDLTAIENC